MLIGYEYVKGLLVAGMNGTGFSLFTFVLSHLSSLSCPSIQTEIPVPYQRT